MGVIAALRAIDEPEAHAVIRRLARLNDRLYRAAQAELVPYVPATADELRATRPR